MTLILYIAFYESRTGNNRVQIINFIDSYLYIPIHYWYDRYMDMDR